MNLTPLPTPTITLSAPVIQLGGAPSVMVQESAEHPTKPVIPGTLLRFINGLLSEEHDPVEAGDSVRLVYFTPGGQ